VHLELPRPLNREPGIATAISSRYFLTTTSVKLPWATLSRPAWINWKITRGSQWLGKNF